ncbi:hypothetical protein DNTS_018078 [Danionella cerebrum]|uniref:Ig-like domain-containing protein n=1 Tax=Danionella cerebrum TaxID=2873325 RepID=A0A553QGY3_9TELE|nr:hypothetical protein DNTS_018078 [Danionella translucida]
MGILPESLGFLLFSWLSVQVGFSLDGMFIDAPVNLTVREGQHVEMGCAFQSGQSSVYLEIQWWFIRYPQQEEREQVEEQMELIPDPDPDEEGTKISTVKVQGNDISHQLQIARVSRSDQGLYECRVTDANYGELKEYKAQGFLKVNGTIRPRYTPPEKKSGSRLAAPEKKSRAPLHLTDKKPRKPSRNSLEQRVQSTESSHTHSRAQKQSTGSDPAGHQRLWLPDPRVQFTLTKAPASPLESCSSSSSEETSPALRMKWMHGLGEYRSPETFEENPGSEPEPLLHRSGSDSRGTLNQRERGSASVIITSKSSCCSFGRLKPSVPPGFPRGSSRDSVEMRAVMMKSQHGFGGFRLFFIDGNDSSEKSFFCSDVGLDPCLYYTAEPPQSRSSCIRLRCYSQRSEGPWSERRGIEAAIGFTPRDSAITPSTTTTSVIIEYCPEQEFNLTYKSLRALQGFCLINILINVKNCEPRARVITGEPSVRTAEPALSQNSQNQSGGGPHPDLKSSCDHVTRRLPTSADLLLSPHWFFSFIKNKHFTLCTEGFRLDLCTAAAALGSVAGVFQASEASPGAKTPRVY